MVDTPPWLTGIDNPYLHGLYAPVVGELTGEDLPVEGEIPKDLVGVYHRNGPNQVFAPRGRHHWFDGDGMVHSLAFRDGRATYRRRFVRTAHFASNEEAQQEQWPGYMERPDPDAPPGAGSDGWLKDSANTDLVVHRGKVLALWYQAGIPMRLDPETGDTLAPETFGGDLSRQVSAHAKVDPETGELLFFDYSTRPPYLSYHLIDADGRMAFEAPIDVPGPRLPHDMAFTQNYAILHDLPLFWDPQLLEKGLHKVTFFDSLPSRFAILPRRGPAEALRWFEAEPAYIYHVVNAWEDGDWVVMDGCRTTDPCPESPRGAGVLQRMMAFLLLKARLYRWRFNLRTGETREEWLSDRNAEFPTIDPRRQGRPTRYSYHVSIPLDRPTMVFDGLLKFDHKDGSYTEHAFDEGWYGSEAPFAPRAGSRDEDDGFVVSFLTHEQTGASQAVVLDARRLDASPLARVPLPGRVPAGFHSTWVDGETLGWT